jgi:hypothetical protein
MKNRLDVRPQFNNMEKTMTKTLTEAKNTHENSRLKKKPLSEAPDGASPFEQREQISEVTQPGARRTRPVARGAMARTRTPERIAEAERVMKAFRRLMQWADRSLSTTMREIFAILVTAYPRESDRQSGFIVVRR